VYVLFRFAPLTQPTTLSLHDALPILGAKADPERDHVRVHGRLLHGPERKRHILLNKPHGYVSSVSDPQGRKTVLDLVKGDVALRSEEHTSELQSRRDLVCRLLLEKKK